MLFLDIIDRNNHRCDGQLGDISIETKEVLLHRIPSSSQSIKQSIRDDDIDPK